LYLSFKVIGSHGLLHLGLTKESSWATFGSQNRSGATLFPNALYWVLLLVSEVNFEFQKL